MPYTPTTWVDGVTPVNATNLNKLENGLAAAVGIPADVVVANNTHLIRNRYLVGDTQPAIYLRGDGFIGWGPGGSSGLDASLYRSAVATLKTDGYLIVGSDLTVTNGIQAGSVISTTGTYFVSGASTAQQAVWGDTFLWTGLHQPGAILNDVYLYRSASGVLKTNASLNLGGFIEHNTAVVGTAIVAAAASGDSNYRFTLSNNGTMTFGPGSAAGDTNLYRIAAGVLRTDGQMQVGGNFVSLGAVYSQPTGSGGGFLYTPSVAGGSALIAQISGEANPKFLIAADGQALWGAGGATATDTNLYRLSAGVLRTDGDMRSATVNASSYIRANQGGVGTEVVIGYNGVSNGAAIIFGTNPTWDTILYRSAAGVLKTDGLLVAAGSVFSQPTGAGGGYNYNPTVAGGTAFNSSIVAEANSRFQISSAGGMLWGPGGATVLDTTFYRGAAGILKTDGSIAHMGRGTTLPASPIDGQEYILVDSLTVPTYGWKFRYDSGISDAYKWVFVGGASVTAVQNTSGGVTSNAAYIDPSNICSLTVARAGIYDITFGLMQANNTAGDLMNWAVKVGSGTPVDSESIYFRAAGTGVSTPGSRSIRKTAAASDLLKMQCKPAGNGSGNNQWMNVIPLRVS